LLDLRGSVELARALSTIVERRSRADASLVADDGTSRRLRELVRDEVSGLRAQTERTCQRWVTKLPDELSELSTLISSATNGRTPRAIAAVAETIWGPLADEATRELTHLRNQFRALRKELGPDIAALSPSAARLERLDSLLGTATEAGVDARIARMIPATKIVFTRALGAAMEALPRDADPSVLRSWLSARGPIRGAVASLEKVVMGALDFEADRLHALVEAASRG
jgi:hypothetical protein